jgi:hypothetical protein
VIEEAVRGAVQQGFLWLTTAHAGFLREEVPAGVLDDGAALHRPPAPIGVLDLLPGALPGAWQGQTATAASIAEALSAKERKPLPWSVVRTAITGAMQAGLLERTGDSGAWPCDAADARFVKLEVPSTPLRQPQPSASSFQAEVRRWVTPAALRQVTVQQALQGTSCSDG